MRESLLYPPSYSVLSSSAWKSRFYKSTTQKSCACMYSFATPMGTVMNVYLTHPAATYKQLNLLWSKQIFQGRLISDHVKSSSKGLKLFLHTFVQHVLCIERHKILQTTHLLVYVYWHVVFLNVELMNEWITRIYLKNVWTKKCKHLSVLIGNRDFITAFL